MKHSGRRIREGFLLLFLLFLLGLLLVNAEVAGEGVTRGIRLCTQTLFPSLFPFLVLSELLLALGIGNLLKHVFSRPVATLFGVSPASFTAFLLGALCGFPIGTTAALSLYRQGEISKAEFERIMLFCNNPSAGFLISAVGRGMLQSVQAGIALFFITQLSALLVALLLRLFLGSAERGQNPPHIASTALPSTTLLVQSIKNAFSSLLGVCAFVLFFSSACACIAAAADRFSLPGTPSLLLQGMLEMTCGISLATDALPFERAFLATVLFAAFSGLCVCFQLYATAQGLAPSPLLYLAAKGLQALVALTLAIGYLHLFPALQPQAGSAPTIAGIANRPITLSLLFFLLVLTVCLQKRKKRSR